MPDQHDDTAGQHEPEQAAPADATAVLDQLERRLGRPLSPLIRQVVTDMAAVGPFATLADVMQAADRMAQARRISPWEIAARMFEQEACDPSDCPQTPDLSDRPHVDQEP